ncbi:Conserved_hypothetical protein [Hexamita inflata]|uniref:Uncharacterized protein n=1 Tax=Hexamita inflata TaxID=28002 RepID=A0AA86R8I4_9EUKA|nr:Conserved hypothetical protein [Hexamita inflata]
MIQYILLTLSDLIQSNKLEITDCYSPKTNIVLVTLNGQRGFEITLDPTGKRECSQLPRGINVTVYATALVDGSNNFIPNSQIIYDFNYEKTVGIKVDCIQCVGDTYLTSDQVIITMKSAIHFTRVVMGAVQTEKGQQIDCFKNVVVVMDKDIIVLRTELTGNCPQLVSPTQPANLRNVLSADFYIAYDNGDIDRYEKIQVGTQVLLSPSPPSASSQTNYTISIPAVGVKATQSWVLFVQMQLYFDSAAVPIHATVQSSYLTSLIFPGGFEGVQSTVQSSSIHIDIKVNDTVISVPGFTGKLSDYYNSQIFDVLQPDKCVIMLVGFATNIPQSYLLNKPFAQKSTVEPLRDKMMTFTINVDKVQYKSEHAYITCEMTTNASECEANLARLLTINNPNFIVLYQMLYYKNNQQIAAISQYTSIADSCFTSADAQLTGQDLVITMVQNTKSKNCGLKAQKTKVALNLTNIRDGAVQTTVWEFQGVDFTYQLSVRLSPTQVQQLKDYTDLSVDQKLLGFVSLIQNGNTDSVGLSTIYSSNLEIFREKAKNCILGIGVASVGVCVLMVAIPIVSKKVKPMLDQKKKIQKKIEIAHDDL